LDPRSRRARGSSSPVSQLNAAPVRALAHGARLTHRPAPCLCTMPATPSRRARAGRPGPAKAAPASSGCLARSARRLLDPADTRAGLAVAVLVLLGEALLTGLIIRRVPCEFEGRERALGRSRGLGTQDGRTRARPSKPSRSLLLSCLSSSTRRHGDRLVHLHGAAGGHRQGMFCVGERERDGRVRAERERGASLSTSIFSSIRFLHVSLFSPFHTTIGRARLRPHRRGDGAPGLPGRPRLAAPGPALGDGRRVHSASAGAVGRAVPVLPGHRPGPHHRRRGRPAGGPAPAGRLQAAALHLRPPPV